MASACFDLSAFHMPFVDDIKLYMNKLDTPPVYDPLLWDPFSVDNSTLNYDEFVRDLDQFLNSKPKTYVMRNGDNYLNLGEVLSSSECSLTVCIELLIADRITYKNTNKDSEGDFSPTVSRQSSSQYSSNEYPNLDNLCEAPNLFNENRTHPSIEAEANISPILSPSLSPSLTGSTLTNNMAASHSSQGDQHRKHSRATTGSSADDENDEKEICIKKAKQKTLSHNAIEKRYRNNLNSKFVALSNVLTNSGRSKYKHRRNEGSAGEQPMPKKSEIMLDALDYIHQLQTQNTSLRREIAVLKDNLLPRVPM
jgi:hypothetical protein